MALTLRSLNDIPLVRPGDDLSGLLCTALRASIGLVEANDVLVVAQKIVSKAEARYVDLTRVQPSRRAAELARETEKDPRLVEVILRESRRVVRSRPNVIIVEHRLGFVMANAGVDRSNVDPGAGDEPVLLLPENPDRSAAQIRRRIGDEFGVAPAVIVSDSFGRAWRRGTVGVALGVAGLPSLVDLRGADDLFGRELRSTEVGFADEIAAAAGLVMGQAAERTPAVLVRGLEWSALPAPAASLVRPESEDLFR